MSDNVPDGVKNPTKEQLEQQKQRNNSPSNTLPILIIWLVYVVAIIIWRIIIVKDANDGSRFDLQMLVWIGGAASFAYMLGGHITDFIRNRGLPKEIGEIKDIGRYKALIYFWILLSVFASIAYFAFGVIEIPHTDILIISGVCSCEYIAGNRANKVATVLSSPDPE